VYIQGKWYFKRASHFHQSKPSLDEDENPLFAFTVVQTEIDCGNKSLHAQVMMITKVKHYQPTQKKIFGILTILQVKLLCKSKNYPYRTLQMTQDNPLYSEAHCF